MSLKSFDKSRVHKILVITLSNIGDVILTCPVIDILREDFPQARLSVVVGPKAKSLFECNPHIYQVIIFDKHQAPVKTLSWLNNLRKEKFDLVVDLRNTAIPILVGGRYRTPLRIEKAPQLHMKQKHLNRLKSVYPYSKESSRHYAIFIPPEDQAHVDKIIKKEIGQEKFIVIAPGAASHTKRWLEKSFAQVCDHLIQKEKVKIVFVGDKNDSVIAERIAHLMAYPSINLCGKMSLVQLACLYQRCLMAVLNDSAPMHLASYFNVPLVAVFGPSDPLKYGPWSSQSVYIKSSHVCPACQNLKKDLAHTCMETITSNEVLSLFQIRDGKVVLNKR